MSPSIANIISLENFFQEIPTYNTGLKSGYCWGWSNPKLPTVLVRDEPLSLVTIDGKMIKGKNGNIIVQRKDGSRVVTTIQGIRKIKEESN